MSKRRASRIKHIVGKKTYSVHRELIDPETGEYVFVEMKKQPSVYKKAPKAVRSLGQDIALDDIRLTIALGVLIAVAIMQ